ncbi:MAG: PriCT-2 domain-containing protein [Prolixibacteraceae bacterium]
MNKFNPEIWFERKEFNPGDWLKNHRQQNQAAPVPTPKSQSDIQNEVETILQRIERHRIDLTCSYADWLKMAFAFADEFGTAGRDYFHRVSRFHPEYNPAGCNQQFDKCLKRGKSGISIKSFFAAARDAGIDIKV